VSLLKFREVNEF